MAVALVMLAFAPYARFIPRPALAGLLMLTATQMINPREVRFHLHASRFDATIVGVTAISAVAISIEFCVLIGVMMSFLLAVPRTGQMLLTEFTTAGDGAVRERLPEDPACGRILIFGLEGEMYFGSAMSLERHLATIESRVRPETQVVVLRMKRARNPDAVGMALLDASIKRLHNFDVHVLTCGVRQEFAECMTRCGLRATLGPENVFLEEPVRLTSTFLAIRRAYEIVTDPCPSCPRRDPSVRGREMYFVP